MTLTSKITNYDPRWSSRYENEAARLRPLFGESLVDMHHVGSTAVPGLAAKPEIDILIVVPAKAEEEDWSAGLAPFGYSRGSNLSTGHQFYKRDVSEGRTHKLHVCTEGHVEIKRTLDFRNLLRRDDRLRRDYALLKLHLESMVTDGMVEYLQKKGAFISDALNTDGHP